MNFQITNHVKTINFQITPNWHYTFMFILHLFSTRICTRKKSFTRGLQLGLILDTLQKLKKIFSKCVFSTCPRSSSEKIVSILSLLFSKLERIDPFLPFVVYSWRIHWSFFSFPPMIKFENFEFIFWIRGPKLIKRGEKNTNLE